MVLAVLSGPSNQGSHPDSGERRRAAIVWIRIESYRSMSPEGVERRLAELADISGYWEFHRACPSEQMTILGVGGSGQLEFSSIENEPIEGHYDAATNAISFDDARHPGELFWVTSYTGYVMPTGEGGACAMAGTWWELTFNINPRGIQTRRGSWYAIWQGEIIP